ncbi:MAG: PEP-CTERM sorting domain-containing protein [Thermoanaerobaculia bacterium]
MTRRTKRRLAAVAFFGLSLLARTSTCLASSFRGLIDPHGFAVDYVDAIDISDDGRVVVGALRMPGEYRYEAFRWTAETGFERLGILGGGKFRESVALAVSADGAVIVGYTTSPDSEDFDEPFRWERSTGMVGLGDLPGGYFHGYASGVSADGSVVVGRSSSALAPNSFGEGFRWTAATGMVGLGVLTQHGLDYSFTNGVSADGNVIVGTASTDPGSEMFRWTALDGIVPLGNPPGNTGAYGLDISADGSVLVGYTSGFFEPIRAFRWTAASGLTVLGDLSGATGSRVWGVSPDGSIVVGAGFFPDRRVATIWDEKHGTRELKPLLLESGLAQEIDGWTIEGAGRVLPDNVTILGGGINPAGQQDGFIAQLGPPSIVQIPTASPTMLAIFAALLAVAAVGVLRLR